MQNKIVPSIWFHTAGGKITEVVEYYKGVFGQNLSDGIITPLGQTPSGNSEMTEINIFGIDYSLLSTEQAHHTFNDSVAFTIKCEDQAEIDKYWNYFTKEGREVQCGWCNDKYGLRWQIIPKNFDELMSKPNSWQIMMKQKKIIIKEYSK